MMGWLRTYLCFTSVMANAFAKWVAVQVVYLNKSRSREESISLSLRLSWAGWLYSETQAQEEIFDVSMYLFVFRIAT